jgi:hypothetical protein
MTRTPDEIYDEIRATPLLASPPSTLAERLEYAEAHVAHYRRIQERWDELSDAILRDGDAPRWGFSAVRAASGYAFERKARSEEIATLYRQRLESEKDRAGTS